MNFRMMDGSSKGCGPTDGESGGDCRCQNEHAMHYASRSMIFAFPDPTTTGDKKPVPFDKEKPFANLGLQTLAERRGRLGVDDVELSLQEFSGTDGVQQILKSGELL